MRRFTTRPRNVRDEHDVVRVHANGWRETICTCETRVQADELSAALSLLTEAQWQAATKDAARKVYRREAA